MAELGAHQSGNALRSYSGDATGENTSPQICENPHRIGEKAKKGSISGQITVFSPFFWLILGRLGAYLANGLV
ncbi:MAG: hypothetical protein OXI38_08455, partial [Bacteroidota bacterium]|nr:hypothetical protein [Bacteroidota bacterium]